MAPTLILTALLCLQPDQQPSTFLEKYVVKAEHLRGEGDIPAAMAAVQRALERNANSLRALELEAELAQEMHDMDRAVHAMHRWSDLVAIAKPSPVPYKTRKERAEALAELDPEASTWERLVKTYLRELQSLGKEYQKREDFLAALEVYSHMLQIDPRHTTAAAAITEVRRTGGPEVAVEDVFAGADPSFGKTPEQIEKENAKHDTWATAWRKNTDNYRYRTDAGYLVLETAAIAMEQMNRFYRKFFRYKLDGGRTPKIEIRIFKSREEYLELGQSPAEWSGGHFIGSAVETYIGGVTGTESIREMYQTLFHEAAHQFVSLTGGFVPGWLNEAYASFFEGCTILSNGTVEWNQVPPRRLYPLAQRMLVGWMESADDGVRDETGEWATPFKAPTFAQVVAGDYEWGPPWYAPTWGVVYFLYNYRADDGRTVYRDALHDYYSSFKRGHTPDPVANFEEIVLRGAPLSPVQTLAELDPIWREYILGLRNVHSVTGKREKKLVHYGDAAVTRGEFELAAEFYEEAAEQNPGDIDILDKLARCQEKLERNALAAATYRKLLRELDATGRGDDPLRSSAAKKVLDLDPLAARYQRIKRQLSDNGLALATSYEERGLPTMALEIARRMSANFSISKALEFYTRVARETGVSLARWRVAYDEHSLAGWSGGGGAYTAYGDMIRANVDVAGSDNTLDTRELACDVTFDSDFSLEAEMRIAGDDAGNFDGSLMGLCFGRKGAQDFHAVVLHPKGFMDISTSQGGVWDIRDHRSMPVGTDWHTVRIDVTGTTLDVYFDGRYVRGLEFPSRESVSGAFGLITGPGKAFYRNVRILPRERYDPAARVERALAMERIMADESLRQEGSFAGVRPPELAKVEWAQGDAVTLAGLVGRPVMLVFWSPGQDEVIPTTRLYNHLADQGAEHGLALVVICDPATTAAELDGYLAEHPMPAAHIGLDRTFLTMSSYYVKPGFHGMPRVLLIDRRGIVQFEGDPGLRAGVGWHPGTATYLDSAFARLLQQQ